MKEDAERVISDQCSVIGDQSYERQESRAKISVSKAQS